MSLLMLYLHSHTCNQYNIVRYSLCIEMQFIQFTLLCHEGLHRVQVLKSDGGQTMTNRVTFVILCFKIWMFWATCNCKCITLSTNANRVLFDYMQYYLNKKGTCCKARVNEWIIIIIKNNFQKASKRFSTWVLGDFPKKCNYFFDLTNFPIAL